MKTVLYVEDERDDVFFMQRAFKNASVEAALVTVGNGRDALHYLGQEGRFANAADAPRPNLVLLDLNIPEVSGFDVLKWVRSQPSISTLPIIVLSSSANESDMSRAALLGANGYMVKPGDPLKLVEMVKGFRDYWLKIDSLAGKVQREESTARP